MTPLATSIGSTITNVVDATGNFFSQLSALNFWSLLLGLGLYAIYLLLRSRAQMGQFWISRLWRQN